MLLPRAFTQSFLVPSTVFFDSKVSLSPPSLSRLSLSLPFSLARSLSLSLSRALYLVLALLALALSFSI